MVHVQYEESVAAIPVRVKITDGALTLVKVLNFKPAFLSTERNDFDRSDEWKECEA
jgi:hypothetical protein